MDLTSVSSHPLSFITGTSGVWYDFDLVCIKFLIPFQIFLLLPPLITIIITFTNSKQMIQLISIQFKLGMIKDRFCF